MRLRTGANAGLLERDGACRVERRIGADWQVKAAVERLAERALRGIWDLVGATNRIVAREPGAWRG